MRVKGVIVAAGYGTRFLPVTRVLPKELLPILDRPSVDFVVRELVDAGIRDIVVLTSRRKRALEDWFDVDQELAWRFETEGATAKRAKIEPAEVNVAFVRQKAMLGAGHGLLEVASFVGDDPFVVAYPDDLFGRPNCTAQLVEAYRATGCSVLSAHDMPGEDVSRYGVLDVAEGGAFPRVRRLVEKPPVGREPSTCVSLGRYLYAPDFLPALARHWEAHDPSTGEYYPANALNELAESGRVVARIVDAQRWDTGTPMGLLRTTIDMVLERDELGAELRAWLEERLGRITV